MWMLEISVTGESVCQYVVIRICFIVSGIGTGCEEGIYVKQF
jgi:hypothetical protein